MAVIANPSASRFEDFLKHHEKLHNKRPHWQLALQVAHNLRFQHGWTGLRLHARSTDGIQQPLLSGTPPQRLYVHPDEQIESLKLQKAANQQGMPVLRPQCEWVLPSHLREKWSLKRFGLVFDAISVVPPPDEGTALFADELHAVEGQTPSKQVLAKRDGKDWRHTSPKRLLLATVAEDSTVVYYITHDGIVKPRQN